MRKKFVQYDEEGNISVICGVIAPVHPRQLEFPEETVTEGKRINLKTLELENIIIEPDSEEAFRNKYPTIQSIINAIKDPEMSLQLKNNAELVRIRRD